MYASLFHSTTIPVLQEAIQFGQARHTVLTGNIANLDTPGYRVRDLSVDDFQEQLRGVIRRRREPHAAQSPGLLTAAAGGKSGGSAETVRQPKTILYHDDSNVGIEHQVTEMVKNQMQHNMALAIMTSQMRLLETAISERL